MGEALAALWAKRLLKDLDKVANGTNVHEVNNLRAAVRMMAELCCGEAIDCRMCNQWPEVKRIHGDVSDRIVALWRRRFGCR